MGVGRAVRAIFAGPFGPWTAWRPPGARGHWLSNQGRRGKRPGADGPFFAPSRCRLAYFRLAAGGGSLWGVKSKVSLWWNAARPVSFTASVIPVLVGTLLAADDHFSWWKALLALAGAVAIHAGTNFVNDYYDYRKGTDNDESLGRPGMIQQGLVTPRGVLVAGVLSFVLGIAMGLVLCATTSWELLWLGVAAVLAGFLYTGAPVHLAYLGMGELTVFIFMGPVIVLGAYFVQVEAWHWQPVVAALPIAFLVTAILHANNLRDIENDRKYGKRTIATVIGRERANIEMYLLLAATYVSLIVAAAVGAMPWPGLIALATAPLAAPIVRIVHAGGNPRKLNFALFKTAQLHMRFGALMAVGLGFHWLLESL
jgi:1,4-dihydroxy-2-naphthoate octaprenyltransferase